MVKVFEAIDERLYGTGEAVLLDDARFDALAARFPERAGARCVIRVDVDRVSDSCGYAVPLMDLAGPREALDKLNASKGEAVLAEARAQRNAESIDGLPGLPVKDGRA